MVFKDSDERGTISRPSRQAGICFVKPGCHGPAFAYLPQPANTLAPDCSTPLTVLAWTQHTQEPTDFDLPLVREKEDLRDPKFLDQTWESWRMHGGLIRAGKIRNVLIPVSHTHFQVVTDERGKCAIKSFHESVRAWMVWWRPCLADPEKPTNLLKQSTLKIPALVTVDFQRSTIKTDKPLTKVAANVSACWSSRAKASAQRVK